MENTQIQLINETDLHKKVVAFIRRFHPDVIIIPGLGEYQTNTTLRSSCFYKRIFRRTTGSTNNKLT